MLEQHSPGRLKCIRGAVGISVWLKQKSMYKEAWTVLYVTVIYEHPKVPLYIFKTIYRVVNFSWVNHMSD